MEVIFDFDAFWHLSLLEIELAIITINSMVIAAIVFVTRRRP